MKKENLEIGKKVKLVKLITDHNGALYEGDIATIFDIDSFGSWGSKENKEYIIFIEDSHGKHHSVSLDDIELL